MVCCPDLPHGGLQPVDGDEKQRDVVRWCGRAAMKRTLMPYQGCLAPDQAPKPCWRGVDVADGNPVRRFSIEKACCNKKKAALCFAS